MKRPKFSIAAGPGDFMPLLIGSVIMFVSLPAFVLMLVDSDQNFGVLGAPITTILGIGVIVGFGFLVLGVQLCSEPGSLAYRISHGRIFSR